MHKVTRRCAARDQQEKGTELMEVVMGLEKLALSCLDKGEAERARTIMEVRHQYMFQPSMAMNPCILQPKVK